MSILGALGFLALWCGHSAVQQGIAANRTTKTKFATIEEMDLWRKITRDEHGYGGIFKQLPDNFPGGKHCLATEAFTIEGFKEDGHVNFVRSSETNSFWCSESDVRGCHAGTLQAAYVVWWCDKNGLVPSDETRHLANYARPEDLENFVMLDGTRRPITKEYVDLDDDSKSNLSSIYLQTE